MTLVGFLLFTGALAAAYVVPGPDTVLLAATAARHGARAGLAAAAGLATARAAHVGLAATGAAALLAGTPSAEAAVRLVCAAYLVWIAGQIGRSAAQAQTPRDAVPPRPAEASPARAYRRGVMVNGTNPKALMFCSVLLPGFAGPGAGLATYAGLGAWLVAFGLAYDVALVALARRLAGLSRRPGVARAASAVAALALLGLAGALAAG